MSRMEKETFDLLEGTSSCMGWGAEWNLNYIKSLEHGDKRKQKQWRVKERKGANTLKWGGKCTCCFIQSNILWCNDSSWAHMKHNFAVLLHKQGLEDLGGLEGVQQHTNQLLMVERPTLTALWIHISRTQDQTITFQDTYVRQLAWELIARERWMQSNWISLNVSNSDDWWHGFHHSVTK